MPRSACGRRVTRPRRGCGENSIQALGPGLFHQEPPAKPRLRQTRHAETKNIVRRWHRVKRLCITLRPATSRNWTAIATEYRAIICALLRCRNEGLLTGVATVSPLRHETNANPTPLCFFPLITCYVTSENARSAITLWRTVWKEVQAGTLFTRVMRTTSGIPRKPRITLAKCWRLLTCRVKYSAV